MKKIKKIINNKKKKYFLTIMVILLSFSNFALAADAPNNDPKFRDIVQYHGCSGDKCMINPIHAKTLLELLTDILAILAQLAVPAIVIMIIYSGFLFFAAQGDSTKLTTAKKTLTWAIVGGVILVSSYGLYLLVVNVLTSA